MIEFEWQNTTVSYDGESGTITVDLSAVPGSRELREYSAKVLELLQNEDVLGIITDTRGVSGTLPEADERWVIEEWGPKAEATGLDYQALVLPEEAAETLSAEDLPEAGYGSSTVQQRLFSDFDEARDWLLAQRESRKE